MRGLAVLRELGAGTLVGPPRLASWAAALGVRYVAAEPPDIASVRASCDAGLLVVDVFPRGVVGELAPLLTPRRAPAAWLVARRVTPAYYLHPRVRDAIETAFEQVVWCEEPPDGLAALRVPQRQVPPVLVRAPMLDRATARARLGVGDDRPLVLALGAGDPTRQAHLARLLGTIAARAHAELRFVSDDLPAAHPVVYLFPASAWLCAADVIVSAGGYHAVHETQAAGVPTIYIPQARRYDDQWWRVRNLPVAADPATLERLVRALLGRPVGDRRDAGVVDGGGGAGTLASLIQRRVQLGVFAKEEIAAMA